MQSHVSTAQLTLPRRLASSSAKSLLFAVLMWLSATAGAIPIPGTPVPITLQTFVLMLAALTLNWGEAATAVVIYLAAGAAGLPVFAGGTATMALVSPSTGFLLGFLPGVIVAALLRGTADTSGLRGYLYTAVRYLLACIVGCVVVVYAFGILMQSFMTAVPVGIVTAASMGFIVGDLMKALIAALAVSGLAGLFRAR